MAPCSRMIAITTMLAANMLFGPLIAMAADSPAQAAAPSGPPSRPTLEPARETVEQRIATLHASLKITPEEEPNWRIVARIMRRNASLMETMAAARSAKNPAGQSAIDDLKTSEALAQAHVNGLKTLTSSFVTLYKAMPDVQKKVADQVFSSFGHQVVASHS